MDDAKRWLITTGQLFSREELLGSPPSIPARSGVYAWWFDEIPEGVPTDRCERRDNWVLLYVGISPKAPPKNGKPQSKQTLRSRVRYHFTGNAEGSTLRLTLGVLLSTFLGIELRRVGSGTRHTFSAGETQLSQWMSEHARLTFVEHSEPWLLEEHLIQELNLPLNLDQNSAHSFHAKLSAQRKAAKMRAAELPVLPN